MLLSEYVYVIVLCLCGNCNYPGLADNRWENVTWVVTLSVVPPGPPAICAEQKYVSQQLALPHSPSDFWGRHIASSPAKSFSSRRDVIHRSGLVSPVHLVPQVLYTTVLTPWKIPERSVKPVESSKAFLIYDALLTALPEGPVRRPKLGQHEPLRATLDDPWRRRSSSFSRRGLTARRITQLLLAIIGVTTWAGGDWHPGHQPHRLRHLVTPIANNNGHQYKVLRN